MAGVVIPVTAQTSGAQSALAALARQLSGVQRSVSNLQGSLGGSTRSLGNTAKAATQAGTAAGKAGQQFQRAGHSAKGLSGSLNQLRNAATALAGAWGLGEIIKAADTYTNINNKLRLVTSSAENLTAVNEALFASANRTRSSYADTAQVYTQLARNSGTLGLSQTEVLGVTESLNQAFQISGATASESASGLRQFGQAMASGVLRGDEFNSLMENAPRVMEAVAAGMKKPITSLRAMAEAGELSATTVVSALQSQAPALAAEFARMTPTVDASMQVLRNNLIKFIGGIDKATGASKTLGSVIRAIANNLPAVGVALVGVSGLMAVAFGGKMVGGIKAATAAVRGFTLALAANPIGLIAVGVATAITALVAFRDQITLFGDDTKKAGDQSIKLGDVMAGAWEASKEGFGDFCKWFKKGWDEAAAANGEAVTGIAAQTAQFFQWFAESTRKVFNAVVGTFVGGFNVIRELWSNLPAVFADIAVSAGNALIAGIEGAINRVAQMVKNGPLGGLVGGLVGGGVSFGRMANPNAGAAGRVGGAWNAGQQDYAGMAMGAVRGLGERGRAGRRTSNGSLSTDGGEATETEKRRRAGEQQAKTLKDLADAREALNVRMREADYTARELAAAEALESAGLDRNVRAATGAAAAIVELSNAVYDAEKRFEDMADSTDMLVDAKASLADATNELLSVTRPALAQHQQHIADINAEYDARMRVVNAMSLTAERHKELADAAQQERDLRLQAEAERQRLTKEDRARDQGRRVEDAQLGARAITDSAGAAVAQQLVQIERERDDALRALIEQSADGSVDAAEETRIIAAAQQEMTNVLRAAHMDNLKTAMGELRNGITTMFQGGKEAMLAYFADLALQFIQAKLLAMALGTTMQEAFSSFGGGGASGGALGAIFGMMGKSGGGAGGGLGGLISGALSAFGRESGGPVSANRPYVVGEKRAEVFVPKQAGMILPSTSVGGGKSHTSNNSFTVGITVNGGSNPTATGQAVGVQMERTIRKIIRDEARQKGR